MVDGIELAVVPAVACDGLLQRFLMTAVRFRSWLLGGVYTAGSLVVLIDADDRLLLVKPTYRAGWGFAGGTFKRKEQPEAAASREVLEEVGISITVQQPVAVYVQPGRRHIDHVYVVKLPGLVEPTPRRGEIRSAQWMRTDQLPPLQPEAREVLKRLANQ